jgi:hypothetical protein
VRARFRLQIAMGPSVTHFIGTQTTVHYANLASEAGGKRSGFDLLVGALTRRHAAQGLAATQAHAQAVQTISQDLRRQGHVLGTTDVTGLLLLVIVPGAAVAGLLLLVPARWPAPAPAAMPGGQAEMTTGA